MTPTYSTSITPSHDGFRVRVADTRTGEELTGWAQSRADAESMASGMRMSLEQRWKRMQEVKA